MGFVGKIACRYLFARKGENFINLVSIFAVLGVALGVAVLNITMSIMTGFENELHNKLVGSSHVFVSSYGGKLGNSKEITAAINKLPEVKTAAPYVQGQVMLNADGRAQGVLLKGILKDSPSGQELLSYQKGNAVVSEFLEVKTRTSRLPQILIGDSLRLKLGLYKGQKLSLVSPQFVPGPLGLAPKQLAAELTGFYKSGLSGYEEALAYTTLDSAARFFRYGDSVTGLEVSLHDPSTAGSTKLKIQDLLTSFVLDSPVYVRDWTELNSSLWEAISLEKRAYFIVLLLLIVLASFSIVTTLIMIVLEKRKDIAVLRTFGAQSGTIRKVFVLMGGSIGFVGTILGLILGAIACYILSEYGFKLPQNVFPTDTLPIEVDPLNFLIVGVVAWAICLLATIYPAYKASKVEPCEILRYE